MFHPAQIIEVGAPGVATPDLASVRWQHLPRPVFPLDDVSDRAMMSRSEVVLMPEPTSTPNGAPQ